MWTTAIVGGVLDLALESSLPDPLRDYVGAWMEDPTGLEWAGLVAVLAALWFMLQGSVRLYRLNTQGRRPFLIGVGLGIAAMPLFGATVYNGWSALLYETSMVLGGVILGWAYFSNWPPELEARVAPIMDPHRPPPVA
jgi:hypothetical protein